MSHGKLRSGKDCLNCGARVHGSYCPVCGQENIEINETLWGLITHFVYDITHFDGKFFTTLKLLLLRPAFLTKEYQRGRRASYLHPIKMYVFTSAVFFFIFFSTNSDSEVFTFDNAALPEARMQLLKQIENEKDAPRLQLLKDSLSNIETTLIALEEMKMIPADPSLPDSLRQAFKKNKTANSGKTVQSFFGSVPISEKSYLNSQANLAVSKRDGFIKRFVVKKLIQLNIKFSFNSGAMLKALNDKFLHSLPIMMFVSMPIMAFFLSLLYWRSKKAGYVYHGVLVIHGYIASYFFIVILLCLESLGDKMLSSFFAILTIVGIGLSVYYHYKSLRNFFEQSTIKTVFKFGIMMTLTLMLFSILSIVFVVNSLLQI